MKKKDLSITILFLIIILSILVLVLLLNIDNRNGVIKKTPTPIIIEASTPTPVQEYKPNKLINKTISTATITVASGFRGYGKKSEDEEDDDEDDEEDEDECETGETRSCGTDVGECEKGTQICRRGEWGDCEGKVGPSAELCDGLDNDCDGSRDETFQNIGNSCTVGIGVCENIGIYICTNDSLGVVCNATAGIPVEEICDDNLDNDCDSFIDINDTDCHCSTGETRRCGLTDIGECEFGVESCINGTWNQCSGAINPVPEICNDSRDNDCDGIVDDGVTNTCTNYATCTAYQTCNACPSAPNELCDGLDNDCDSSIDETFTNLGNSCSIGIGVCQRTGVYVCTEDGLETECNAVAGAPNNEVCEDGLDNDCDGYVDEEDEDCRQCENGQTRQCGLTDIGACEFGTETCEDGFWGECVGAIYPVDETCDDDLDNDCDNYSDNEDNDCIIFPVCGNGIVEEGEECDDNNNINGDGCSSDCRIELECNARSYGYWKTHEGCSKGEGSSIWVDEVNSLSDNFAGVFAAISGKEICILLDKNCYSDMLCKASKMLLADELNVVAGYLDLKSLIDATTEASDLGLENATVEEALRKIEELVANNSNRNILEDAKDVAENIYYC